MASQKKLFAEMALLLQQEPGSAPGWEQRSRGGKTYWIRRDRFDPEGFFVAGVPYAEAKKFVKTQHYSRAWALSVVNIGLYKDRPGRKPKLCGVAVFGMGPGATTLNKYFYDLRALELVRFVLLPEVKYYGETWFLRRAFAMLKQASWRGEKIEHYGGAYLGDRPLEGILAFSDPVPRTKLSGEEVMPGHVGHIYQAYGGLYSGRAGAHKDNILLPDGTVIDKRSQGKVSRQEQGADGVYARLVAGGARVKKRSESWSQWMSSVRFAKPFRRQIHPGTHAFVWKLGKPGFPQDYYYRSYRAPGTVEERRRLAALIRQLQEMERNSPRSTSHWLQQEIEELKDRLRGMELVDPHSTPPNIMGYPRKVDIPRVLGGTNRRARWWRKKQGGHRAKAYPWLSLSKIKKYEPLMQQRGVSKVARSPRGFLTAYKRAGTKGRLSPEWRIKRDGFISRHWTQARKQGRPLYETTGKWKGTPTRWHLALIAWGFSPDGATAL